MATARGTQFADAAGANAAGGSAAVTCAPGTSAAVTGAAGADAANSAAYPAVCGLPGMDTTDISAALVILTGTDSAAALVDLENPNRTMPRPTLTQRERDVLLCWLVSDSKTDVCTRLGLSPGTVKTHLHRIRGKYEAVGRNASTKAALVARALQDGLVRLEDL